MSAAVTPSPARSHGWLIAASGFFTVVALASSVRFAMPETSRTELRTRAAIRQTEAMPPAARSISPSNRTDFSDAKSTDPLARALATVSFKRRTHRFERLGASLAAKEVRNAFRTLAGLDIPADREAFIRGIFGALAGGDKVKAMLATHRLTDKSEEDIALMALVDAWIGPNNGVFNHAARIASDNPAAGFGRDFMDYNSHPELLALWARTLTQGKDRADLLTLAASREYGINPAIAESYGTELTGSERVAFDFEMLRVKPFDLAWREGSALSDPVARADAQNMLLEQISEEGEPNLAAERLAGLPQEQHTEMLFSYVASDYGMIDNPGAWKWLDQLSGKDADMARAYITMYTPSDLRATFTADAEGYPVVATFEGDEGGGPPQFDVGDRVLAISSRENANTLVEVRGMDLSEVVKLTQGLGNSVVKLRIAPTISGGGYSEPVMVQIRRLLMLVP